MDNSILRLRDNPEYYDKAVHWFHEKWEIPLESYQESMNDCIKSNGVVPQWYIVVEKDRITAGMGVIENDSFKQNYMDVCAVYTAEDRRSNRVAGELLNFVCEDMKQLGIDTMDLLTNHKSFFEHYGSEYYCMVECNGGELSRVKIKKI